MPKNEPLVTIEGIVMPADWDAEGHVTAVSVSTSDELEYRVAGRKSRGLFQLLRKPVLVRGYVSETEENRLTIRVESFYGKSQGPAPAGSNGQ
ncbi:MAG: hypothetical protein AB1921_02350 [Thermodesulfobacteriota bacterium]